MKLRNKKTGEIGELRGVNRIVVYEYDMPPCRASILGEYDTLAEFNEDWEDYKPAEPLIKDEKIRKAVRAWAEANGITKVLSYGDTFWLGFRSINTESVWKFECSYADASDFESDKEYTITELCGEEEE